MPQSILSRFSSFVMNIKRVAFLFLKFNTIPIYNLILSDAYRRQRKKEISLNAEHGTFVSNLPSKTVLTWLLVLVMFHYTFLY